MAEKGVAKRRGVSLGTVRRWRMLGAGPRFAKFGQLVRYRQSDIDRWAEAWLIDSTQSQ
jgi:predicted DNA-binding transcriptional regulator AlpA